jgi:hypothetical protein
MVKEEEKQKKKNDKPIACVFCFDKYAGKESTRNEERKRRISFIRIRRLKSAVVVPSPLVPVTFVMKKRRNNLQS